MTFVTDIFARSSIALRCLAWAAAALALLAPPAGAHPLAGRIFAVADGTELSEAELAARLAAAELVVLGEVHDNPLHHAAQARLVAALKPGGIAFEHIPARVEGVVNGLLSRGEPPEAIGEKIGWEDLGWPDWTHYAPILAASPGAHVAGGGVERPELMAAIREGAAAAWGPSAADWGLDLPFPDAVRADIEAEMVEAHCGMLPPTMAPGMVEAQRLRDARFAAALLRARQQGGEARAVLVTGNGHARRDRGVPLYLRTMAPDLPLLSVGILETAEGLESPADYPLPYDFVLFTAPAERPDPCEELRRKG